ncbi:hypothetical protein C2W62_19470 [Candidatus Entotheonella serta]|nr:hypothetical protein C2W62_19470 [Candidatus Entotheonella serta]
MPIYEYRCLDCDHEFERMQKFSDPPLETCPSCEGTVQKLISRSTFHLKGNGWYVTDYARKSGNNNKSESTTTSEAKSESSKSERIASRRAVVRLANLLSHRPLRLQPRPLRHPRPHRLNAVGKRGWPISPPPST